MNDLLKGSQWTRTERTGASRLECCRNVIFSRRMRIGILSFFVLLVVVGCGRGAGNPVASFLQNKKAGVFVFLAPDCPLSQNYTLTLNNLEKEFNTNGISFYGVFSGGAITSQAMDDFAATYHLSFPVMLDADSRIGDFFGATATPEAFLTDPNGHVIYKGAIDNWAPELGQHRAVITQHYLYDALDSVRANKPVQMKETQAVGCFIERKS